MNKELIKQLMRMKYNVKKDSKIVSSARLEIIEIAKRSYMSNYTVEEIEDAFQDSLLYNYKRALADPKFAKSMTISNVISKMRQIAFRNNARKFGLNLDGSTPLKGKNFHIDNITDSVGNNLIEQISYKEDGTISLPSKYLQNKIR